MFFRLLVFLSFLFAFDANGAKFFDKLERGLQKADRFITEFNYAIGATPNPHTQIQSIGTNAQYGYQTQPFPNGVDRYLDYTPEYQVSYRHLDQTDETKFLSVLSSAMFDAELSGYERQECRNEVLALLDYDKDVLDIDDELNSSYYFMLKENTSYDDDDKLIPARGDRAIPEKIARRKSWTDRDYMEDIYDQQHESFSTKLMVKATFLRYELEKLQEENPEVYRRIVSAIETYYTGILIKNIPTMIGTAIETGGASLVATVSSYAILSGAELFVEYALKKGGDEFSWRLSKGNTDFYASYLKTCDFFIDFIKQYGLVGAVSKKLQIHKTLPLYKTQNLLARRVVKDAYVSKSVTHKGQAGGQKYERKGVTGYKCGFLWDSLHDVNTPEMMRKIGKINKQAFGGGEMRTDGVYVYRFDPVHKTGKIHLERYRKVRNKVWQGYGEIDPETGNLIEGRDTSWRIIKW